MFEAHAIKINSDFPGIEFDEANISRNKTDLTFEMSVPGFSRADLDITTEDDQARTPLSTSELIGYKAPTRGRRTYRTAEVIQGSKKETARFDRAGNKIER